MTGIRREPRSLPICRRFSRAIRKLAGPGWILPDAVAFSVRAGFPPTPLSRRAGARGSIRNGASRAALPSLAAAPARGIARRFGPSATFEAAPARAATAVRRADETLAGGGEEHEACSRLAGARESGGRGVPARPLAWSRRRVRLAASAALSGRNGRARLDSKRRFTGGGGEHERRQRSPARARESGGRGVTAGPIARGPDCVIGPWPQRRGRRAEEKTARRSQSRGRARKAPHVRRAPTATSATTPARRGHRAGRRRVALVPRSRGRARKRRTAPPGRRDEGVGGVRYAKSQETTFCACQSK